jgi:hypothetical protein
MKHLNSGQLWMLIELFGHTRIAGLVTEQVIGGCSFVRVDVPGDGTQHPFTRLYGQGAIYSMTFVDHETAKGAARMMRIRPVDVWSARRMLEAKTEGIEDHYDDDEGELANDME